MKSLKLFPTLGVMIRARRLGWHLSRRHGAFIRISDAPEGRFYVELHPMESIPKKAKVPNKLGHRCWWEGPDNILDEMPWLRGVTRVKQYIVVVVDENGAIVSGGAQ